MWHGEGKEKKIKYPSRNALEKMIGLDRSRKSGWLETKWYTSASGLC